MCGIAGAIGWIDAHACDAVDQMSASMVHRGPDDCGAWRSPANGEGACFGFRRLSILDLSPLGHQPMVDPQRGHVLVFNGEIYNHQQLRAELEREGETFKSTGDSEVILKGYARWGSDVVERLRGMFAIAIWDAQKRTVLLARDRLGIKPLYVASVQRGGRALLLFASELRALLRSGLVQPRMSAAGLASYVWNGFVVGPPTMVDGVRLLPAGTKAIVRPVTPSCEPIRYWSLPHATVSTHAMDELRDELQTAVKQHLVSDTPLGVFLSGGVDSSAITAMAAQQAGATLRTFNVAFDEAEYDESRFARAVADALGTQHEELRLTAREFQDQLPCALASLDQPTFDGINTYFVSRAAKQTGVTVALAGTGGDELFGGYRSFRDHRRAATISRWMSHVPSPLRQRLAHGINRGMHGRFGDVPPQTRWGKLSDLLASGGHGVTVHQISYALFTRDFLDEMLHMNVGDQVIDGLPRERLAEFSAMANGSLDLHAVSMLELSTFIGERLLRDTDCTSMAVSLEVRVPLLDHRVVEAASGVPPRERFHPLGRKQVLRTLALQQLDPAIFNRPKSGFELPIERWCRSQMRDQMNDAFHQRDWESIGLNSSAVSRLWRAFENKAPGLYWSRVWCLFVLRNWCREHNVRM